MRTACWGIFAGFASSTSTLRLATQASITSMAGSVPLRCNNALFIDLTLEEAFRRFDQLLAEERVEKELAKAIKSLFRSQFRDLVHGSMVVDEEDPAHYMTLEELLEGQLRCVARLRTTASASLRRRSEQAGVQEQ